MIGSMFKGYVMTISGSVVLAAVIVLIALQWGNQANFSLYGRNMTVSTWLLMLGSAVGGVVAAWFHRLLLRGVAHLRKGKQPPAPAKPS